MAVPLTARECEVYEILISLLPPGCDHLYDFDPDSGDFYKFFAAVAKLLKANGYDLLDALLTEINPATVVQMLPEWERCFGILPTAAQLAQTPPVDRQATILSRWRESGSYSLPAIRAIIGVLLGYVDTTQLVIIESGRTTRRTARTVTGAGGTIPGPGELTAGIVSVVDGGTISGAGVQVRLLVTCGDASKLSAVLTGPDGKTVTWPVGTIGRGSCTGTTLTLRSLAAARRAIMGTWHLALSSTDTSTGTLSSWSLFVEGTGKQTLAGGCAGGDQFYWAPFADPTLVGIASTRADWDTIQAVLNRIKPAHTKAYVVSNTTAKPSATLLPPFIPKAT